MFTMLPKYWLNLNIYHNGKVISGLTITTSLVVGFTKPLLKVRREVCLVCSRDELSLAVTSGQETAEQI